MFVCVLVCVCEWVFGVVGCVCDVCVCVRLVVRFVGRVLGWLCVLFVCVSVCIVCGCVFVDGLLDCLIV